MIENRWMSSRAWFLPLPLLFIMASIIGWPFLRTLWVSFTDARLLDARAPTGSACRTT